MNKTLQSNDKSMSKYYYSIVYRHYFIVIINKAFYVAVFNVLYNSSFIKPDHNIIKHSFLLLTFLITFNFALSPEILSPNLTHKMKQNIF